MNPAIDLSSSTLPTERLVLRPFLLSDLDGFFAYASVPGVGESAGWKHHENKDESLEILKEFIAERKTFAVAIKEGPLIGSIGIESYKESEFPELAEYKGREIGYVIAKDHWGKGICTEGVKAVIAYCFEQEGYDFLLCAHGDFNVGSRRVQEKSGFVHYKKFLGRKDDHGSSYDGWYSLIWNPSKPIPQEVQEIWLKNNPEIQK